MHYGRTAVSLFVFYMLILQGLIASAAWATPTSGPYADAICISKASNPIDGGPAAPARHSRHDACCVFHAASFGAGVTEALRAIATIIVAAQNDEAAPAEPQPWTP